MDYIPLVAGSVGSDVVLDRNNPRMCVEITLTDDAIDEMSENLMVRFNIDPALGAVIDGNFRFDPNITEVVIQNLEGENKYTNNYFDFELNIPIFLIHCSYYGCRM